MENVRDVAGDAAKGVYSIHADRRYDADLTYTYLNASGIRDSIPRRFSVRECTKGNERDAARYIIERFFA